MKVSYGHVPRIIFSSNDAALALATAMTIRWCYCSSVFDSFPIISALPIAAVSNLTESDQACSAIVATFEMAGE